MTNAQKIALRLSEVRKRLGEIAELSGDNLTVEIRAEFGKLKAEHGDLETRQQAAIIAEGGEPNIEPGDDAEARELRELETRASLTNYAGAALEMRGLDGAERELNEHLEMPLDSFPLRLLARGLEVRTTTDTDTTTRPTRWLDRLFADTAAAGLGLTFDSVPAGVQSYPVTATGGTPAQRGRGEAIANSAWTITTAELKPSRMGVHYRFAMEDAARMPGLESALERDLRMSLTERTDFAIFAGDDGANENTADIPAITDTADITAKTLTQTAKTKGPQTLAAFVDLLDGIHAESVADLRTVAFVGANRLWRSTNIAGASAQPYTMAKWLADAGLSWRTRGGIEADTTNGKLAAMIGLGRGLPGAGVVAVWEGAKLIRDPYSGAQSGEVRLTLQTLWNYKVVRASNFAKISFVT